MIGICIAALAAAVTAAAPSGYRVTVERVDPSGDTWRPTAVVPKGLVAIMEKPGERDRMLKLMIVPGRGEHEAVVSFALAPHQPLRETTLALVGNEGVFRLRANGPDSAIYTIRVRPAINNELALSEQRERWVIYYTMADRRLFPKDESVISRNPSYPIVDNRFP